MLAEASELEVTRAVRAGIELWKIAEKVLPRQRLFPRFFWASTASANGHLKKLGSPGSEHHTLAFLVVKYDLPDNVPNEGVRKNLAPSSPRKKKKSEYKQMKEGNKKGVRCFWGGNDAYPPSTEEWAMGATIELGLYCFDSFLPSLLGPFYSAPWCTMGFVAPDISLRLLFHCPYVHCSWFLPRTADVLWR